MTSVHEGTITYGDGQSLEADAILVATGRAPATEGLDLAVAGVTTTDRGAVVVDGHLRTSKPHIFALGDVNGGPQFTYISLDDSRILLDQLAGEGRRSTADRVAGHRIRVAREAVADIVAMPRAYVVEETRGMMKFIDAVVADDTQEAVAAHA